VASAKGRFQIWTELMLRPTWRWLLLAPLAVLGTLQTVRDETLPPATAEKYRLDRWLPNWPWEWYAIIALGILIFVILESAYRAVQKERSLNSQLEAQLDRFNESYAYALAIDSIDHQETRQLNRQGTDIIAREGCLVFRLKNTIARPVEYRFRTVTVDGREQTKFDNRGTVISAHASTSFYLPLPLSTHRRKAWLTASTTFWNVKSTMASRAFCSVLAFVGYELMPFPKAILPT
jgi:hypothetical protein